MSGPELPTEQEMRDGIDATRAAWEDAEKSLPLGLPGCDRRALEEVRRVVALLPTEVAKRLAAGPADDCCRVCEVLGKDPHPASRWLYQWHGTDPIRCGVIYALASTQPTKETYTREQLLTPVVRAEPEGERITFELECGHVVGLALADTGGPDNLPTALLCPVCERHEFDLYSREDLEAERERVANAMCATGAADPKYRRLLDRLNLIDDAIHKGKGGDDG